MFFPLVDMDYATKIRQIENKNNCYHFLGEVKILYTQQYTNVLAANDDVFL